MGKWEKKYLEGKRKKWLHWRKRKGFECTTLSLCVWMHQEEQPVLFTVIYYTPWIVIIVIKYFSSFLLFNIPSHISLSLIFPSLSYYLTLLLISISLSTHWLFSNDVTFPIIFPSQNDLFIPSKASSRTVLEQFYLLSCSPHLDSCIKPPYFLSIRFSFSSWIKPFL